MTTRPINILIVEDQLLIAMDLGIILEEAHPCIVRICRHENMKRELSGGRFDIVFADAGALKIDEFDVLKQATDGSAALVFLCSSEAMAQRVAEFHPSAVMEKPFDEEAVRRFVLGVAEKVIQ